MRSFRKQLCLSLVIIICLFCPNCARNISQECRMFSLHDWLCITTRTKLTMLIAELFRCVNSSTSKDDQVICYDFCTCVPIWQSVLRRTLMSNSGWTLERASSEAYLL
jgi:hypothetical protein